MVPVFLPILTDKEILSPCMWEVSTLLGEIGINSKLYINLKKVFTPSPTLDLSTCPAWRLRNSPARWTSATRGQIPLLVRVTSYRKKIVCA